MTDVRTDLELARSAAPSPDDDLEGLYRRRAHKIRRQRVATFAVVGCIVLGSLALVSRGFGSGGGAQPRDGSAIGMPTADLAIPAGSFYYQRIDVGQTRFEMWWAADDSGRIERLAGGSDYGIDTGMFDAGQFPSDSGPVNYLSTDPAELEQQLRDRVEPGGASPEPYADWTGAPTVEWGLIRSIGELLEAPDVTPAVKAALLQVAAGLDVVTVDPHATDPLGRDAILLTSDTEQQIHRWWFDPQTHQLMAANDGWTVLSAGVTPDVSTTQLDPVFVPSG